MKKICLLLFIGLFSSTYAQEDELIFFKDYNLMFSHFAMTGSSMTTQSHIDNALGFELKLGIVEFKKVGLAVIYNNRKHKINNTQMIGDFDRTRYTNFGFSFRYNHHINEKMRLKPEIAFLKVSADDIGYSKEAEYSGPGYALGVDYVYKLTRRTGVIVGVHYQHTTFKIDAASQYRKYFRNANQIQLKIGFNFGSN